MRLLISGLSILLCVTVLCVINQIYLKASLDETIDYLEALYDNIEVENWERASQDIELILESWCEKRTYYTSVMFHSYIDDVESILTELKSDIEDMEGVEAKKRVRLAQVRLEQLIFEEILSLGNIL